MTGNSIRRLRSHALLFLIGWVLPLATMGQNHWPGTYEMHYKPWPHIPAIQMTLKIAEPTAGMLYPANLELTYRDFHGVYELLLVKKNGSQLGIGRNKYPVQEQPFSLGPWLMYLNGVFEQQPDSTAGILLKRLWLDNFGVFMSGLYNNELYTNNKAFLRDFLYQGDILLEKTDQRSWKHDHTERIIHSDSIYYGVYDPIDAALPHLSLSVQDEERYDRDTVTIVHNGRLLADRLPLDSAMALDSIKLDTGENYIALFADNYGDLPPNTANFILGTAGDQGQLYAFDFGNRANAYATVMVAHFRLHLIPPEASAAASADTAASQQSVLSGKDQRIGRWNTTEKRIILEIWDEQVEDGDIISLTVNGATIAEQVNVTKNRQRFGVSLSPGRNHIVFRARNLGRIPPNTAALRVSAGGKEQVFHLSTDFERNNVLEIFVAPNR